MRDLAAGMIDYCVEVLQTEGEGALRLRFWDE